MRIDDMWRCWTQDRDAWGLVGVSAYLTAFTRVSAQATLLQARERFDAMLVGIHERLEHLRSRLKG